MPAPKNQELHHRRKQVSFSPEFITKGTREAAKRGQAFSAWLEELGRRELGMPAKKSEAA